MKSRRKWMREKKLNYSVRCKRRRSKWKKRRRRRRRRRRKKRRRMSWTYILPSQQQFKKYIFPNCSKRLKIENIKKIYFCIHEQT